MRPRFARLLTVTVAPSILGGCLAVWAAAQALPTSWPSWVSVAEAAGAQGGEAVSSIPRTADGTPDLSGFWQVLNTAYVNIQDHRARRDEPAGQGVVVGNEIPYQPWALEKRAENFERRATEDPAEAKCHMPGVPRVMYMPLPFQIIQQPHVMLMRFEWGNNVRFIHTNGTPHPDEYGPFEWYMGDSRGRWDGDTLVTDVTFFNDKTWFDHAGDFHSAALHVVERFTLTDADHIRYDVTIEDPEVFTRPWEMSMILYRRKEANFRILEYPCWTFDIEQYYPYPELAGDR